MKNYLTTKIAATVFAGTLLVGCGSALVGCQNDSAANDNKNNANVETTNKNANENTSSKSNKNDNKNTANDNTVNKINTNENGVSASGTVAPAENENTAETTPSNSEYASGVHHAILTVEGYEPIEIELDADAAPITVENFAKLVNEGYYNGLTFYRFQDGFCIQGGTYGNSASGQDPNIDTIVGEFSDNGYDNPLADNFTKGTIAMARTTIPDSASSTFFITLDDSDMVSASLNGQYAAFGTVSPEGMVIVDQIVKDHVANADDAMGMVSDEGDQALIESIVMVD